MKFNPTQALSIDYKGMSTSFYGNGSITVAYLDCDIYDVATKATVWRSQINVTLAPFPFDEENNVKALSDELTKKMDADGLLPEATQDQKN